VTLLRLAVAQQSDIDLVPDAQHADGVAQFSGVPHGAVDGGNDVAGLDAGVLGRRSLRHGGHQGAARFGQAELLGDLGVTR
jgi:hypothetical protein